MINSRLDPFTAPPFRSIVYHGPEDPFFRSYGANLPSSLTKFLSLALVYSTIPPVSVCGTVNRESTLRSFSWQFGISAYLHPKNQTSSRFGIAQTDFPIRTSYALEQPLLIGCAPNLLRSSITHHDWYRNIKPVSHRLRLSALS